MLSKNEILQYFEEINEQLKSRDVYGEIVLAGGAALTLVFNARNATKDIDAIFKPSPEFREIIGNMAQKHKLEKDWLNDGVKGFLNDSLKTEKYKEYSNLKVYTIDAEGLLALKLTSARRASKDMSDSLTLMKHLDIQSSDQLLDIIEKHTHKNQQTVNSYYFTLEAFEKYQGQRLEKEILSDNTITEASVTSKALEKNAIAPVDYEKKELYKIIKNSAVCFVEDPEKMVNFFKFSSKFYSYSLNNNILIHAQNPHAQYVQSFTSWKDAGHGYFVKEGEKGIKILVPVKTTVLETDQGLIPLRDASKEQKEALKSGQLKSKQVLSSKVCTVFDISQTTIPKERYHKIFSMGYSSEQHRDITKGLKEFASKHLNCPVLDMNSQSNSLRGNYNSATNTISLNQLLNDTEQLSTLSHELGHAIVHSRPEYIKGKSRSQIEFEADAISVMLQCQYGLEPKYSRQNHLADNYKNMLDDFRSSSPNMSKNEVLKKSSEVLQSIFDTYKKQSDALQQCISHYISAPSQQNTIKSPKLSQTP